MPVAVIRFRAYDQASACRMQRGAELGDPMVWMQRLTVATLAVSMLVGCSASPDPGDPVAETCDGGPSVGTPEKAIETLLQAAIQDDTELACTVTTGAPEGTDLGEGLAELRAAAQERGLSPDDLRVEEVGDTGRYTASGTASSKLEPLEFELNQVADKGFRIYFPAPEERGL